MENIQVPCFDTSQVDALSAAETTCSSCYIFREFPCPQSDWENRDPKASICVCYEEKEEGQ